MPVSAETCPQKDSITTKPITVADFKQEVFDGLPLKRHVPRHVIEDKKGSYYQIPPWKS